MYLYEQLLQILLPQSRCKSVVQSYTEVWQPIDLNLTFSLWCTGDCQKAFLRCIWDIGFCSFFSEVISSCFRTHDLMILCKAQSQHWLTYSDPQLSNCASSRTPQLKIVEVKPDLFPPYKYSCTVTLVRECVLLLGSCVHLCLKVCWNGGVRGGGCQER